MKKAHHRIITHSFFHETALAANTNVVCISPAANVNGAILRSGCAVNDSSTIVSGTFIVKDSAPASQSDGMPFIESHAYMSGNLYVQHTPRDVYLPPGMGLYYRSGGAESTARKKHVLYELL